MVEVSNAFKTECEANVGTYKFGKIKVNYIDDNPLNYEQGAYSSSDGAKKDAAQSVRYNKLVECKPNFKYKIELGNSVYKMKIVTYTEAQAFIAAHDNLIDGNELTTEATAKYISVTIYSNDTLEGTSITLSRTIRNGEIAGTELKGNTSQNGTPTPGSPIEVKNVTGEQVVRVCRKNLFDLENAYHGSINASGVEGTNESYRTTQYISTTPNTNYYFSTTQISGQTAKQIYIAYYDNNKNFLSRTSYNLYESAFTTPNNCCYMRAGVYSAGQENIMLELGSTKTTYEPYQGKDYEVNLGKNLMNLNLITTRTSYGVTFTKNNDGTITLNNTATGTGWVDLSNIDYGDTGFNLGEVQNTTKSLTQNGYTMSAKITNGKVNVSFNGGNKLTACYVHSGTSYNNAILEIQFEKNTQATEYTPYFEPIELNKIGTYQDFIKKGTGKNLFDGLIELGSINADTGELTDNTTRTRSTNYTKVKPNTWYRMTRKVGANRWIIGYKADKTAISDGSASHPASLASIGTGGLTVTFKTSSTTEYIKWYDTSSTNTTENVMISEGTEEIPFEPYGYGGKWYIEKNVGKVVLNGSESGWGSVNTQVGKRYYLGKSDALIPSSATNPTIVSNRFPYMTPNNSWTSDIIGISLNTGIQSGQIIIKYNTNDTDTVDKFKTWLSSNNATTYYQLATPTFTEITNTILLEQLEAVNHAQTQEGTSNILVSGDLPAILKIAPDLTESIRGKQTTPIVGYTITGDDDLINFKITSKADSNGNILGATSQSQVDIEIFNENNTHNLENKQVYISTGLAETAGNYCKWQPFTITQTKDTQTKNHTTYTGYDDMMRGNEAYIDNIDYGEDGITLYDFTCNLAKEMGMALGNTTMTNGEFVVKGNNFTNNETKLVVLKNIAQMVGGFAMIDRNNLLRIVELSPENAMTPIELTTNLYTEDFQNSAKFGEINEIAIGETNLETNAIVRSDEAAIAKDGVKKIEILDNLFLGMLADKELAIDPLWDAFEGFNYYPFKTQYNGYPYIDLGDKLNITDINSNVYGTMVLNHVFEYNGGYKGNIGAEALSITAAKYQSKNTLGKAFQKVGIDINRVEGKITQEVTAMSKDLTTAYSGAIETSEKNIMGQVKTIQTTLYGPAESPEEGLTKIVETHSTQINTTSQFVNIDIKNKLDTTYDMADAVTNNTKEIIESFNFSEDGMLITNKGSETADMALLVSNAAIIFKHRGNNVLVINGEKIEFSAVSFQKLDLGNYVWQAEQDDSLSLIYEGGNS